MSSTPAAPQTPAPESYGQQISDYINSMPEMLAAQQQYGPQFAAAQAQQQYQTEDQYAPMMQQLQQSLYPELTKMQNSLQQQTYQGMQNGGIPPAMQQQYQDQMKSNLGTNVSSPIGSDYLSRGMINQGLGYQQYYQNMAATLTGAQPLYQAGQAAAGSPNLMSGFGAGGAVNYGAQSYGNYANAYSSMYGSNANLQGSLNQMIGESIGGISGGVGSYMGSSQIAAAL